MKKKVRVCSLVRNFVSGLFFIFALSGCVNLNPGNTEDITSSVVVGNAGSVPKNLPGNSKNSGGEKKSEAVDYVTFQRTRTLRYRSEASNSLAAQNGPYVIFVSIDGFRYDYLDLFRPENLIKMGSDGVRAQSLQPIYPSKTFPNHYTLVTGLSPEKHGIVSNDFYDPVRKNRYSLRDRQAVEDGTWYGGEPLWVAAEKKGYLSSSFFWVGSEANIQNAHPNTYFRFEPNIPESYRTDQALDWLSLPPEKRPHLIMLYFENVDSAAHKFGVRSQQTQHAIQVVDAEIGRLRHALKSLNLPVNLIVVSDHGMADLDNEKTIFLDSDPQVEALLQSFQIYGHGPHMQLYLKEDQPPAAIKELKKALLKSAQHLRVYEIQELKKFRYKNNKRVGDLVIEPDLPYVVELKSNFKKASGATHGWDPTKYKSMHGIFIAEGPAFKKNFKTPTFENIHVYPLILDILGVPIPPGIDGRLSVTSAVRSKQK